MWREGAPAWMQAVDRVGNRPSRRPGAARQKPESDHFVIPAKAGIQWFRPSIPACRQAGMTTGMTTERGYPAKPAIHSPPGLPLLDSSFRWNDGGGISSFMDRMSGMRREGTPAWMYACMDAGGRPRREQAVEVVDGVGNRPSRRPGAARSGPESTPAWRRACGMRAGPCWERRPRIAAGALNSCRILRDVTLGPCRYPAPQNSRLPGARGKGITSRILETPETSINRRSNPRPKPACGTLPYLRVSRYHQ